MDSSLITQWIHTHDFAHGREVARERRTFWVVFMTSIMMVAEITGGWLFNSKAVFADGWHMGTHTLALAVGLYAYRYARMNATNPIYSFGAGKVHALGSFISAMLLSAIALFIFGQSVWGLIAPRPIEYNDALMVAGVSFIVNCISIWLLHGGHEHEHEHEHIHDGRDAHAHHDHDNHEHDQEDAHGHKHDEDHDHTFKAAYTHVIADAMTSILALLALCAAKYLGWRAMDPIVGIIGSLVIAQWAYNLLKNVLSILLDRQPTNGITEAIRSRIEADHQTKITDLHVWSIAPGKLSVIVSLVAQNPDSVEGYKQKIRTLDLAHVTIEVNPLVNA